MWEDALSIAWYAEWGNMFSQPGTQSLISILIITTTITTAQTIEREAYLVTYILSYLVKLIFHICPSISWAWESGKPYQSSIPIIQNLKIWHCSFLGKTLMALLTFGTKTRCSAHIAMVPTSVKWAEWDFTHMGTLAIWVLYPLWVQFTIAKREQSKLVLHKKVAAAGNCWHSVRCT